MHILRTIHNSPYYVQIPSHTPTIVRRNDAAGNATILIVIAIVVAFVLVGFGSIWAYLTRLNDRRSTKSGGKSRVRAKFGSSSLRSWSSRNINRADRGQERYQRFGSESNSEECPRLPPACYVGLFQTASAIESGEGYELEERASEDIREVQRLRQGDVPNGSEAPRSVSPRAVRRSCTDQNSRFRPGEHADLFVIGEDEEIEADHRYTFNSDEVPKQWGNVKRRNSDGDLSSNNEDSLPSIAEASGECETRVDHTDRPRSKSGTILRFGITTRCHRHLNDSAEAVGCIQCEALSMDFRSDIEARDGEYREVSTEDAR